MAATFDTSEARRRCQQYRLRILDISQRVSALHASGAFSCLEIVDCVYFGMMNRQYGDKRDDTFLLSKGHGSLAQYVVLEKLGILEPSALDRFCKPDGILGTHPDLGQPGIEAATGSLGHGMPIAVGMALADRLLKIDRKVFVVQSDGEMQEGSVWESMMLAPTWKLNNLIAFVDLNDFQSLGRTSETHPNFYPLLDKAQAFGWEAVQVDGHDSGAVFEAFANRRGDRPFMVIGKTIKGKGVSFMENVPIWHYRSPNPQEYEIAVRDVRGESV